ncbi:MAG: hypothetical protein KKC20_24690 [Proteobacteria bacterium]|nr:hypothetical protein [Pseudomonadota bacterium]
MPAIEVGRLRFRNVFVGDLFDVTFQISGIDLTGKTLRCQVRKDKDSEPVLTFSEDDNSIQKTIVSTTLTTVRFYKTADEMANIPILSVGVRPILLYYFTVVMFTDDSDVEDITTIIEGDMEVVPQLTQLI